MKKVKMIVHESYQGKRKPEEVFASVLMSACGTTFTATMVFEFGSKDLYYSLQHVNISFRGKKRNSKWIVNTLITDRYDFDSIRTYKTPSLASFANDIGYLMQKIGTAQPFDISLSFICYYSAGVR